MKLFDLHCDTVLGLLGHDFSASGSLAENNLHIDLKRARDLAGYVQCFACFTTTAEAPPEGRTVEDVFERELSVLLREFNANENVIKQAFTAEDIDANTEAGIMSAVLSIEGPAGFGFDPALLENLYQIGFRISTLGWNEKNVLCGSNVTGGGLTDLGKEYVKEAQRLGMIIDVSHISDEAFWDIMKITNSPIVATHSNSRAICNHSRNLSDDMFRAICETGGVAGLNLYADFIGKDADLNLCCDHILHFMEMDPDGKHIALGGDLDGCDILPAGFEGIQDYPKLSDALLNRGLEKETVGNIFYNNALGVIKKCCM